jgi:small-conductance mechanosensitive channel
MNSEQKIQNLERQVAELTRRMDEKARQQITFPLDDASRTILSKYFLTYISNLDFTSSSGQLFPRIIVGYNGVKSVIDVTNGFYQFTANATTNVLTLNNPSFYFNDGDQILLYTTNTLPAPLSDVAPYFVINSSANTFKVSDTFGGAEIDITDTGTGAHFALYYT